MRCDECLTALEEFYDGELDDATSEQVTLHCAACAECRDASASLALEHELYAHYRREVEVTPALWQAIEARLQTDARFQTVDAAPAVRISPVSGACTASLGLAARLAALFNPLPRTGYATAAAFVLVACGLITFLVWRQTASTGTNQLQTAVRREAASSVNSSSLPASPAPKAANDEGDTLSPATTGGLSPAELATLDTSAAQTAGGQRSVMPGRALTPPSVPAALNNHRGAEAGAREESGAVAFKPVAERRGRGELRSAALTARAGDDELAHTHLLNSEEAEVARHIEKAQVLLRSFRNARLGDSEAAADVAYERRLSRELLNETTLLRASAESSNALPARQLLSTLEPLLLDIANLTEKPSREDVRSIKDRMQRMEIIAALEVY